MDSELAYYDCGLFPSRRGVSRHSGRLGTGRVTMTGQHRTAAKSGSGRYPAAKRLDETRTHTRHGTDRYERKVFARVFFRGVLVFYSIFSPPSFLLHCTAGILGPVSRYWEHFATGLSRNVCRYGKGICSNSSSIAKGSFRCVSGVDRVAR